jgi:beta-glucosidase
VEGLQGRAGTPEFLDENHVVATAKHFIADGGTFEGDDQGDVRISEHELIDIHAPGYVSSLEAGAQTVMASFSSWNGKKVHADRYLLTDVLKDRMGFEGLVVSDWNAHGQLPGCTYENCPGTINAGIDLVMVTADWKALLENTLKQVRAGEIPMARLDDAVRRILTVKLRAGLFENKPSQNINAKQNDIIGKTQHRELARQAVRESIVLLKNKNNLLPLDPRKTYLVAGDGADNLGKQAGGWSINWQGSLDNTDFPGATSIYEGIRQTVAATGGKAVLSVDGIYKERPDAAIIVFGENPYAEWLGDLATLEFEPRYKNSLALLKKFSEQGIPTVSLFISGRPLWVNPEINASDVFVAVWLPGSEGAGVADVIFADADGAPRFDFKGRLSFSWPKLPLQGVLNPHHPDYDPLFPLGYGLNYASQPVDYIVLPVDVVGVDSGELKELPLYVGRPLTPWVVVIKNHERGQTLSGAFAELPKGDVAVITSDKDLQEDALTFRWRDAKSASLSIEEGKALDISEYLSKGALTFDLKINTPPTGDFSVVMKCGQDCERRVKLNKNLLISAGAEPVWQSVTLKLSCFSIGGMGDVSIPFMFAATGTGDVSVANIILVRVTSEETLNVDC